MVENLLVILKSSDLVIHEFAKHACGLARGAVVAAINAVLLHHKRIVELE